MIIICARDHGRLLYRPTADNAECPACRLVEERAELQSQVDHLNTELHDRDNRAAQAN